MAAHEFKIAERFRIEGGLTPDYVKVKRITDIDLSTLEGKGRLEKGEAQDRG